jgi:signal transduction histidine kinase
MQPSQDKQPITTNSLIHDVRNPLNRISMQAEMVKLVLENDMPKEKAIVALDKILAACQDSSAALQKLAEHSRAYNES